MSKLGAYLHGSHRICLVISSGEHLECEVLSVVCLFNIIYYLLLEVLKLCVLLNHNRAYSNDTKYLSKGIYHILIVVIRLALNEYSSLLLADIEISVRLQLSVDVLAEYVFKYISVFSLCAYLGILYHKCLVLHISSYFFLTYLLSIGKSSLQHSTA